MAEQKKQIALKGKALSYIHRHKLVAGLTLGITSVILIWLVIWVIQTQIGINNQAQRFNVIRPVLQSFEGDVRQQLGASLINIQEYDSCYHLAQSEAPVPFITNGILYCGKELKGAAGPLVGVSSSGNRDWDTSLAVSLGAKQSLQQSGLKYTQIAVNTDHAVPKGNFSFSDEYNIYSSGGVIGCDLTVSSITSQIYFVFNCFQPASKNFFTFVPSGLD